MPCNSRLLLSKRRGPSDAGPERGTQSGSHPNVALVVADYMGSPYIGRFMSEVLSGNLDRMTGDSAHYERSH